MCMTENLREPKPPVRLSAGEIDAIRAAVRQLFGAQAKLRVFGSRTDLREKGGDIDLMVETDERLPNRAASAVRLTSELQRQLGERKIDDVVVDPNTPPQPIHRIARETGVML